MESPLSVKRIFRDLKELNENKLVGIAACIPDEKNIRRVHANILLQEGLYKGLLIPIKLDLSSNYPLSPPAAYVVEKHPFNHNFHEHIFEKSGICTDLTSNFAGYFNEERGSGWTPAYTIQSVLLQLQTFLSRPDLPKHLIPSNSQIKEMLADAKTFVHKIKQNENGKITYKESTFKNPFPSSFQNTFPNTFQKPLFLPVVDTKPVVKKIYFLDFLEQDFPLLDPIVDTKSLDKQIFPLVDPVVDTKSLDEQVLPEIAERIMDIAVEELTEDEKKYMEERAKKIEISNKLICPITKVEYAEANKVQFGYPILVNVDKFGRLHTTPVIEIISQEGLNYLKQTQKPVYNDQMNVETWKSIFWFQFNYWVPIYINKNHFDQIKDNLIKLICDLTNTSIERSTPTDILKLIPPLLVKTSINFIKGEVFQSFAAIDAYCQFQYLLMKLIQLYPEIQTDINEQVNNFMKSKDNRNKKDAGDLGEFMIKASLSKWGFDNPKIKYAIFVEFLTRQVSWIAKEDEEIKINMEMSSNLVGRFFSRGKVAKEFFVLQNESAKLLVNDTVLKQMESRLGFISDETALVFRRKLGECQKNVEKDWKVFIKMLDLDGEIKDEKVMKEVLVNAIKDAKEKYADDIYGRRYDAKNRGNR